MPQEARRGLQGGTGAPHLAFRAPRAEDEGALTSALPLGAAAAGKLRVWSRAGQEAAAGLTVPISVT